MPNENATQELLQGSDRSTSPPADEINKFREVFLPLLIICIACAPIAYLLSLLITEVISSQEVCNKRVVGYYTVAEWNKLKVNQMEKLTHLVLMFAYLQDDGSFKVNGGPYEAKASDMKEVISVARKRENLKIMIAIGGLEPHLYSPMVSDPVKNKNFMDSITKLFDEYDIDGIEIVWMYVSEKDKVNHLKLTSEVRQHLISLKTSKGKTEDYVLSTGVSRYTEYFKHLYNNEVLKHVDFLTVQSHDWSYLNTQVGPIAPLYGGPKDSIDDAMKYLVCQTEQPSKLNLGIPMFGMEWRNTSFPINDSINQLSISNKFGKYFSWSSYYFWRDKESRTFSPSEVTWHEKSQTPYISRNSVFVSFENEKSVQAKTKYINMKNLGGIAIHAIDQDDKNILMNAIVSVDLCSGEDDNTIRYDCE